MRLYIALSVVLIVGGVVLPSFGDESKQLTEKTDQLIRQGDYRQAVETGKTAVEASKRAHGERSVEHAWALDRLATAYQHAGDLGAAEPLFARSLEIREKKLGKDHIDVTASLNNLAGLYQAQGRFAEAEPLYKGSLEIREKKLGKDHLHVAISQNNLALLYQAQGRYAEAEPLYKRSLEIRQQKLGKDHLYVATSLNNLAWLYRAQGRYAEAEPLYKKSLSIYEKALGKDHPHVATSLTNLASLYQAQGRYADAEPLYNRSLEIREKKLGRDHPEVSTSLNCVALLYHAQGRYSEAEPLYKRSLEMREQQLGRDHPYVADCLNNLALLYYPQGRYSEAEPLYKRSLEIKEKKLGKDHPSVAQSLNNLAALYYAQRGYAEAEPLYKKSLAIYEKALGKDHPEVATSLNNLALLYLDQADVAKTQPLIKQLEATHWKGDIPTKPAVAKFKLLQGDHDAARKHYTDLRDWGDKTEDFYGQFVGYTGLGTTYEQTEAYDKAQENYQKAIDVTEAVRSGLQPAQRKNFYEVRQGGFYRSDPAKGLTRVRLKLNQPAQSIDASEMTKARAFSDNIAERSAAGYRGVPLKILDEESTLVSRRSGLHQTRSKTDRAKNPVAWENLTKEIDKAQRELDSFVAKLRKDHPAYASAKYPRPVKLKESAVRPEEHLLAFDVVGDGVGVKLIKGKEILTSFYVKWKEDELEQHIKRFRGPFEKMSLKEFDPELGKDLYKRLLLRALVDVPEGTPLVIVPDGVLADLPFEALVIEGKVEWKELKDRPTPQGITFVGDRYPISYYQSITALTLARTLGKAKKPGNRLMVMVDPVFGIEDERLKGYGQEEKKRLVARLPEKLMSMQKETGMTWPRLHMTSNLGESLNTLHAGRVDLYEGMKARKEVLFNKSLQDYRAIVFATHGYFGTDLPGIQEPVLALTLVDQPPGKDGFLRMTEVMGMNLNADVVALTACQTGLGKHRMGEGSMNMGRAFQYAGAKTVFMSLWSVAESSSVNLVGSFFRNLKDGKGKLEALQLARREIRQAGFDHPFFWAPFILVGEVN
ncbi:MAG: CHAT domain-containing tetratricopeptide repeat protein [Thermodesulfobacteriota bacterium]